ncbi:integral peroxisomal membrane peroxin-domain-containing protein [Cristinia sonorae]|uniref:Integral peroxisomal membrane peroxin-domain-containing protein n=1 Tax=Cristinia sonorae TaxID=1940300 RepID=A0A8K0UXS4_9AGAR|nr:integral peroxisomal membrane peroxin-domain-containing protein [Cristinia sonorae]
MDNSFTDFLSSVPSPLVAVLVGLAPFIASLRHLLDVVSWKSSWEDSWLTIALWWAACLLGDVALRYVFPIAVLAVLFVARSSSRPNAAKPPVTEDALQRTIADLSAIQTLLPHLPSISPTSTTSLTVLLRVSAILYIPYLSLTYLVRLRILVAVAGTIALTWRARWAALIRRGLWRSAWIRWGTYHLWSKLSGQPLPPRTHSPTTVLATSAKSSAPTKSQTPSSTNHIRFLFTVYENQRWWMGLDWTAALLPAERPSWCSSTQQPVAPPSAFTLPTSTTAYIMEGSTRMKRTATWKWEEEEWRVLVCKEGQGLSRIERPVPKGDDLAAGAGANRILKAAGKMRQASMSGNSGAESEEAEGGGAGTGSGKLEKSASAGSAGSGKAQDVDEETFTDADGWVYGDNKWEHGSNKGGMGKYTRFRRWTRIAVLTETIEPVGPGELGVHKSSSSPTTTTHPAPPNFTATLTSPTPVKPQLSTTNPLPSPTSSLDSAAVSSSLDTSSSPTTASFTGVPCEDANRLKQRLQNVVKRTTLSLGGGHDSAASVEAS